MFLDGSSVSVATVEWCVTGWVSFTRISHDKVIRVQNAPAGLPVQQDNAGEVK